MNAPQDMIGAAVLPNIKAVADFVCARFAVSETDLISERRDGQLVRVRHIAIWLAVKVTGKSLPAIGRSFRRDHTTILYAKRRIEQKIATDAGFAAVAAQMLQMVVAEEPA